jgi:biofilm PGA synthesis N-glycosyltransferase PgaC
MIIVTTILLCLFIVYASLLVYYRLSWQSIPNLIYKKNEQANPTVFISVIIPARNEEKNITALLNSLRGQSYPASLFEVIVVDDYSTDRTADLVRNCGISNVRLISLKDIIGEAIINSYKKKAIEVGIGASKGALIVTTDADCMVPEKWLEKISAASVQTNASMLVMPVAINYKNRFIEIFQALDFMTLQGITGAAVHKKLHSMCNGANLAYTRSAFDEVGGFEQIDHIASGDDMLLMHKMVIRRMRVCYLKSEDVIVGTEAVGSVKEFFQQRIRWASKADKYQDKTLFPVLLTVYLFNAALLFIGIIAIFVNPVISYFVAGVLILKTLTELLFLYPIADFFKMKKLLWYFPLMQPLHILYTVIAGWLGKFGSYKWKERKVQ